VSRMNRREALASLGLGAAAINGVAPPQWERFRKWLAGGQQPRFFSDAETATVRVLADMIIPRDEHSGAATDAGSVEYMDFVVGDAGDRTKQAWHDGLRWLDEECQRTFQKNFTDCDDTQRGAVLDLIAWPARARPELSAQVEFFNRARDLSAAAFFSSRMGVEDIRYMGGVFNPGWQGAPPEALRELGVTYDEWDGKYGSAGRGTGGPARPRTRRP